MKWKAVREHKDVSNLKIEGATIETDYVDKQLNYLLIKDASGNIIKFVRNNTYENLVVQIPAPPEMIQSFEVSGTVGGIAIKPIIFKDNYGAKDFISCSVAEDKDLKITEIEVPVE